MIGLIVTGGVMLALVISQAATTQQAPDVQTFSKVKYLGGAPSAPGRILAWDNVLSVSPDSITLRLVSGTVIDIIPSSVEALTYAGVRHTKRWDELLPLSVFIVGQYVDMKRTNHFLTIEYTSFDNKPAGVLLELHKDNVRQVIDVLERVTSLPSRATTKP